MVAIVRFLPAPDVLLGLDGLVEPVDQRRPASTRPVNSSMMSTLPSSLDHVVDVALVERVRAQALLQDVQLLDVRGA
jgi:hypothetical protein